jgi:hypothetical protein
LEINSLKAPSVASLSSLIPNIYIHPSRNPFVAIVCATAISITGDIIHGGIRRSGVEVGVGEEKWIAGAQVE